MDEQQSELEREPEEAPHEPNAVEDPAYYYDIVERHSRMIQVKMHFRRWIFHLILRLVYIPVLLATYIASNNRA